MKLIHFLSRHRGYNVVKSAKASNLSELSDLYLLNDKQLEEFLYSLKSNFALCEILKSQKDNPDLINKIFTWLKKIVSSNTPKDITYIKVVMPCYSSLLSLFRYISVKSIVDLYRQISENFTDDTRPAKIPSYFNLYTMMSSEYRLFVDADSLSLLIRCFFTDRLNTLPSVAPSLEDMFTACLKLPSSLSKKLCQEYVAFYCSQKILSEYELKNFFQEKEISESQQKQFRDTFRVIIDEKAHRHPYFWSKNIVFHIQSMGENQIRDFLKIYPNILKDSSYSSIYHLSTKLPMEHLKLILEACKQDVFNSCYRQFFRLLTSIEDKKTKMILEIFKDKLAETIPVINSNPCCYSTKPFEALNSTQLAIIFPSYREIIISFAQQNVESFYHCIKHLIKPFRDEVIESSIQGVLLDIKRSINEAELTNNYCLIEKKVLLLEKTLTKNELENLVYKDTTIESFFSNERIGAYLT